MHKEIRLEPAIEAHGLAFCLTSPEYDLMRSITKREIS